MAVRPSAMATGIVEWAARDCDRPDGQIIIETLGSAGVLVDRSDGRRVIPTTALTTYDTTGAGDTLAGETIARYLAGGVSIEAAVEFGMAAAGNLLASRIPVSE